MRYVFGPSIEYARPEPVPTGPKADAIVTIAEVTDTTVTLSFTAPDPVYNHPAELRVYLVAQGLELPADVDGYLASGLPVCVCPVSEADVASATVSVPEVPKGVPHLLQTIVGYAE